MNATADSAALLREFAEHRSETAFAALVRGHLDLVYSVALRRGGGRAALAEEVCQLVFIDLARKAAELPAGCSVAGWLYQHTCFVVAKQLRAESRRHRREEIAMQLQTLADDTDWSRLAPVLDDALLELAAADRDPLVQRYFGQRSFAEIGAGLGLSENAARMRVDRALDKLRAKLAKRGVTSTAAALAAALAGPAVTAAPATLAATITTTALAAAVTTTSTLGLLSLMASTKLKVAIVTAVLAAAGTALVLQHQAGNRLHTDNADLQRRVAQLTEAALAPRKATMQSMPDPGRSRELLAELLRLCGAFTQLQQKVVEQAPAAAARDQTAPPVLADRFGAPLVVGGEFVPHEQWGNAGSATPEAAAMTILWAWRSRNLQLLKEVSEPMTETTKLWLAENDPRGLDEEMSLERVAFIFDATQAARIKDVAESFLNLDQAQVQLECLKRDPDEGTIGITLPLRFASGTWRMAARQPLAAKP